MKKLLLLLSLVCIKQVNAQLCFSNDTISVNNYGLSITGGDFNGDGKTDLATTNSYNTSYNINVLLGTGTGGFGAVTSFYLGTEAVSIISADFNGDGKADLATADFMANLISIFLGTGTGSFGSATNFTVGPSPYSITCADFNGDGKKDLATANSGSTDISVLLGNGSGGFGAALNFTAGSNPYSVTNDDFNGDGKVDLAVANNGTNNVSILLGTGTGSFGTATNFTVGNGPWSIISSDFNGDGKKDLATVNSFSNDVSILLGTGTGSFSVATSFSVAANTYHIISSDFDNDGKIDLAIPNGILKSVSIYLGNGNGSFGSATNFPLGSGGGGPLVNVNLNGDSKVDLAVYGSYISILLNCTANDIANFSNKQEVVVYPNPTSDQFFIDANATDKLNVDLYDVNGRHVFSKCVNDKSNINVTTLNEGFYSLTIKTVDRTINKKLVIVR